MNWQRYISDKRFFLLFFFIIMLFIGILISVDPLSKITLGNFIYLYVFTFVFLIAYLVLGYIFKYRYWKDLEKLVGEEFEENIHELLPRPRTREQAFFNELMRKKHHEGQKIIDRLQNKQEEYHDFILYWVHEVKTPIVASKMLVNNPDLNDTKTIFRKIDEELDKMDKLVMQALYFSRLDTFAKDYFIQEHPLDGLVRESIKRHSKLFISGKKKLTLGEMKKEVRTDSKWFGFILDQIISNALKYTEKEGEINIYVEERKGGNLSLNIKDNGRGIKEEDLPRVFQQGFTGNTGRQEKKATGMGLYLAKQMAFKLGHSLKIHSEFKKGTTVSILFEEQEDYLLVAKDENKE